MSAYSTINITRGKAMKTWLEKFANGLSDEELERFMDEELDSRLYNCRIVPDHCENDDNLI